MVAVTSTWSVSLGTLEKSFCWGSNTAMFQKSRVLKESNVNTETLLIMGSNDGGEHS